MKIAFLGTPEFANPFLEELIKEGIEIECVITQPDRPMGRKQHLAKSPVKILAEEKKLTILQPKNKLELGKLTQNLEVDFFVVIAFGMILPKEILEIPKHGSINVHASLLPKYRGASPIQESLLNGDQETGLSIIEIDEKLDHGPIYLTERIKIDDEDTYESLAAKIAYVGAQNLPHALEDICNGLQQATPQDENHEKPSYCRKISKEDGTINFQLPAERIKNMLRAYTPWPGIFTTFQNKKLKIKAATIEKINSKMTPGTFFIENRVLKIQTQQWLLIPERLQFEGKNEVSAKEFINGNMKFLKEI